MRKLVVAEFMTLDGVVEAPYRWTFEFGSKEQEKFKFDALLLGRLTYEGFAATWPHMTRQTDGFGVRMNNIAHVVSTTLEQVHWDNSSLIRHDVAEEISKLKQQPGQDILVFGSISLVQSLMAHDPIDEYRLMVFPVVVGQGKRLFGEGTLKKTLKLLETQLFGSSVVLRYAPVREP